MWRRCLVDCHFPEARDRALLTWLLVPMCALAALLTFGCATEDGDWARAQSAGSIEAYEKFLDERPSSRYAQQAVDLVWKLTDRNGGGKAEDYEKFLQRHATSPHKPAALDRIWGLALKDNTKAGYEAFLAHHGTAPHAQEAVHHIWSLTVDENTIAAYEDFSSKHPKDPLVERAREAVRKIWVSTKPTKPDCPLTSELTVDVSWQPVPGAESYVLYWSGSSNFAKTRKQSEATTGTFFNHTAREGEYGAQLPMYYRVAAVKAGGETALSGTCVARLLSDRDGTRCQICGEESVGYCHLREIYVCSTHNTFTSDSGTAWQCP